MKPISLVAVINGAHYTEVDKRSNRDPRA